MGRAKYPAWLGRFGYGPSEMKHTYYGYSNLIVDFYIDDLEKLIQNYGDAADSMTNELNSAVYDAADTIAYLMSFSLSKSKTWFRDYSIAASGKASENIEVRNVNESGDRADYQIWEGDKTIANTIIRRGLEPGTRVPKPILLKWLKDKNIELHDPEDDSKFGQGINTERLRTNYFTTPGYTTHRGRTVRPAMYLKSKGRKKIAGKYKVKERILEAIQNKIFKEGASDYWSLGYGDGRFDYVRWAMDRKSAYMPYVTRVLEDPIKVAMYVIRSGKGTRNRPNIYSKRKITRKSKWR